MVVYDFQSKSVIRDIIISRDKQYLDCYERQLQIKRDSQGEIMMRISISNQGKVLKTVVLKSTINNSEVERCIADNIKELNFPAPKSGKRLTITYPLRFMPKN